MKIFKPITLVIVVFSLMLLSCYDDNSTSAIHDLPEVSIDTTGINELSVLQFDRLTVEPKIQISGVTESDLTYKWELNFEPRDTLFAVVGTEMDLDILVERAPSQPDRPYNLVLTVNDTTTGLDYIMNWPLHVRNNLGEGLIVADTRDGTSTDLSLIMSPDITTDYDENTVVHQVYSAVNGGTLNGLIKDMQYVLMFGVPTILGIHDDGIYRINREDLTYENMNEGLFFAHDGNFESQTLGKINQGTIYVEGGELTGTFLGGSRLFGAPFDAPYTVPDHVAMNAIPLVPVAINFYDEVNGHFAMLPTIQQFGDNQMQAHPSSTDGPFNPGNLQNMENLAAGVSSNNDFRHILRDKDTGEVALYLFDGGGSDWPNTIPPAPTALYDMADAPDIDNAIHFAISDNQRVLYYATESKVYAMLYGGSEAIYEERYEAPVGEEITLLQIYQQANYPGGSDFHFANNRTMIVSTYDGSNGNVHLIPITNLGVGNFDILNTSTFEGFGRVISITAQE